MEKSSIEEVIRRFPEIWLSDFEFATPPGGHPKVVCLAAREFRSGRVLRVWEDEFPAHKVAPYSCSKDSLVVAYAASAEMSCHLSLGWPLPENVLDLFAEFRNMTNGEFLRLGSGLLGAMAFFQLPSIDVVEKDRMRELILRGGPWTVAERVAILDYCEGDSTALKLLLPKMLPHIDLNLALLRGRYTKAVAQIEKTGIPINRVAFDRLRVGWKRIQGRLISQVDTQYGVYQGLRFKCVRFEEYLERKNFHWPRLCTGQLDLKEETFRDMVFAYPELGPLRELRSTLSKMREFKLAIGSDHRNRVSLVPFRTVTGRNASGKKDAVFDSPKWLRGLIQPEPGKGLAYVDWAQQEFGIAAALSGDETMMAAYRSGDAYLAFAKRVRAVPESATKDSHERVREPYKQTCLGVQYGGGPGLISLKTGLSYAKGQDLRRLHLATYPGFWKWGENVLNFAHLEGFLYTVFGWTIHLDKDPNPPALLNFPMQANGAEMMRLASCLLVESGISVCTSIHDAFLIEAPIAELDEAIRVTQHAMSDASAVVLNGFRLRSDVKKFVYPDRYHEKSGEEMWGLIWKLLEEEGY